MSVVRGRRLAKLSLPLVLIIFLGFGISVTASAATSSLRSNSHAALSPIGGPLLIGSRTNKTGGLFTQKCYKDPGIASCYTMTLRVTGAQKVHGTTEMSEGFSCRQYLSKTAGGGTEVPLPTISLNGGKDTFSANLEGWKGPGTYKLQSAHNNKSFLSVGGSDGLLVGQVNYSAPVQGATKPAKATAVVGANGDVSIAFSNLAAVGKPTRVISGEAQYSCKNI